MDIVRIFEQYCNDNNIIFQYGSKSVLNLTQVDSLDDADKIHILLDKPRRKSEFNSITRESILYSGNFFIVLTDNYDNDYFKNPNTKDAADSKYTTKIEPLLLAFKNLERYIVSCGAMDVVLSENIDATDVLDENFTGLWVTYQYRSYE